MSHGGSPHLRHRLHIDDSAGARKGAGEALAPPPPLCARVAGYCTFFLYGLACWWTVSAFSLELPAFLAVGVPEGLEIANDLNVAVTAGNVVVILYLLLPHRVRPSAQSVVVFLTVSLLVSTVRAPLRYLIPDPPLKPRRAAASTSPAPKRKQTRTK